MIANILHYLLIAGLVVMSTARLINPASLLARIIENDPSLVSSFSSENDTIEVMSEGINNSRSLRLRQTFPTAQFPYAHYSYFTTFAGTPQQAWFSDIPVGMGGPATQALLYDPTTITVDTKGNVYFCQGNKNVIMTVNAKTRIINIFSGNSSRDALSYQGDGQFRTFATFNYPQGITRDNKDNIYIVDSKNALIRVISNETGIISRFAGILPEFEGLFTHDGDGGPAINCSLSFPQFIAISPLTGFIFVTESKNPRIRMIDDQGMYVYILPLYFILFYKLTSFLNQSIFENYY